MYDMKILELVSIKKESQKTLLHIRLSADNETELLWTIDNTTASNLIKIFDCNGLHKYRLSLHSTYDRISEKYTSSITKTYRDLSEPLIFDCSVDYKNCLDSIKNSPTIAELTSLPFINTIPAHIETNYPIHTGSNAVVVKKRVITNLSWLIACLILIMVLSLYPSNKTTINSTVVLASPPEITNTAISTPIVKTVVATPTTTLSESTTQSSLPSIKIDESLTYSLPDGHVALTFDDGPSKYTTEIIDILKNHHAGGTFFFLGLNAKKYPESVRYAIENGYSVGNHSMKHANLTKLSIEEQKDDLLQSTKILEEITEQEVTLFRPPYGAMNEEVTELIHAHQYKIVQWNKDPKDWNTRDPEKIVSYVRDNKASGSIIILHESQTVIDALPEIIEILKEQHLQIVNLY